DKVEGPELRVLGLSVGGDQTIGSVFSWAATQKHFFGFGNLRSKEDWTTAFYRIELSGQARASVITELQRFAPERVWFRLGFPFVTMLGERGCALRITEGPAVSCFDLEASPIREQRLRSFPEELANAPDLKDYETPEEFTALLGQVESSTMPAGLYGWEGDLFLLWRRQLSGKQEWLISRIDPNDDRIYPPILLPTRATHLMVIPGPVNWAIVEKGRVEQFGVQAVESIKLVSSSYIRDRGAGK
ncbi:MAG: hypothetical protein SF066_14490, partial [Thermoanaerobaculia bacterium]|nr:hypothetical protein [Thermoanaerobaculia bacterium]